MFKSKKILALVPARSGSKGLKNKNILPINKKPLLGYTGEFLKKIKFIDKKIISTDSKKYAEIANEYGLESIYLRSKKLSEDRVSDLEVLNDALEKSERYYGNKFDIIIYLQPTSPLRRKIDLIRALNSLILQKLDSIWSVSEVELKYHPLKQLIFNKNLDFFHNEGKKVIARQQLSKTYIRNGVFYIMTRDCILKKKSIIGKKSLPYIIKNKCFNIDDKSDLLDFKEYIDENTK